MIGAAHVLAGPAPRHLAVTAAATATVLYTPRHLLESSTTAAMVPLSVMPMTVVVPTAVVALAATTTVGPASAPSHHEPPPVAVLDPYTARAGSTGRLLIVSGAAMALRVVQLTARLQQTARQSVATLDLPPDLFERRVSRSERYVRELAESLVLANPACADEVIDLRDKVCRPDPLPLPPASLVLT
jgi:hypothetical protein